jgi:hypothetical protein
MRFSVAFSLSWAVASVVASPLAPAKSLVTRDGKSALYGNSSVLFST